MSKDFEKTTEWYLSLEHAYFLRTLQFELKQYESISSGNIGMIKMSVEAGGEEDLILEILDTMEKHSGKLHRLADVLSTYVEQAEIESSDSSKRELQALKQLSDDALWTLVQEQMPQKVQTRVDDLMKRNNKGIATEEEQTELEKLTERMEQLTPRKAEAVSILKRRGYDFTN